MIDIKYQNWIKDNVTESYGACAEITLLMLAAFPQLERVRGHYLCPIWGRRTHWWLQDPEGNIVDPTVDQFPSKGVGEYIPWPEGTPEPTGKCLNCGDLCYEYRQCCSDTCNKEFARQFQCQ